MLQATTVCQCEHHVQRMLKKTTGFNKSTVNALNTTNADSSFKSKVTLTVMSNGVTLKQTETIVTLVSWNLKTKAMRKENKTFLN